MLAIEDSPGFSLEDADSYALITGSAGRRLSECVRSALRGEEEGRVEVLALYVAENAVPLLGAHLPLRALLSRVWIVSLSSRVSLPGWCDA